MAYFHKVGTYACNRHDGTDKKGRAVVQSAFDQISYEEIDVKKAKEGMIGLKVKGYCACCKFVIDRNCSPIIHLEILEPRVAVLSILRRTYVWGVSPGWRPT